MSSKNQTKPNTQTVPRYIAGLATPKAQAAAKTLCALFTEVTKKKAVMWGDSLVGFGSYHYTYDSGREGDFLATGFSIRKSGPTIYIMPGYNDYQHLLNDIGPHKLGKSCLYLKSLEQTDLSVLKKLIKTGLKDLARQYPVS